MLLNEILGQISVFLLYGHNYTVYFIKFANGHKLAEQNLVLLQSAQCFVDVVVVVDNDGG